MVDASTRTPELSIAQQKRTKEKQSAVRSIAALLASSAVVVASIVKAAFKKCFSFEEWFEWKSKQIQIPLHTKPELSCCCTIKSVVEA